MYKKGIEGFPYYLGIASLADVATRDDRVCVLNILGGESRQVTPVSHVFSGGNVVFGTSPGRRGQVLATSAGDIPVYNNVREGLDDGISFSTGVVYLPPSGVRDGVAELIRVNPDLRKIVMITEKIAVHDAREIRALGQANGIDILGANCLGVADSWNRVRIGGALGGDNPEEVLLRGRSRSSRIPEGLRPPSPSISALKAGERPRSSHRERTYTSTTRRGTSRMLSTTTCAARLPCSTPSPAVIMSAASNSPSRLWPASSVAGSRS
jgi:Succinyl-CoA synthetase, alpha subunit